MFISYSPAEKKKALFFEFRTIIPLENHGFGDRPFLPFEVGRARANAMITLAWLKLTTWFGCGSAVNEPISAVLNQLANLNGLKGQLINLSSTLRRTGPGSFACVCKVCVLSVFNFWVCLPCVVTCLFPCLVLVLPCSRHVLSYVCLSMPCALLLLSVSPPLTCSQSPGLFVLLVSPVSC